MAPIPIEPSADIRQVALLWRQVYLALLETGFTPDEVRSILATMIAAAFRPNPQ